ncbi:hypothetical protein INR49_007363 [Caranx melampygus]|nr:hypothetical protein INR49_007363 [Caranx melampygus]
MDSTCLSLVLLLSAVSTADGFRWYGVNRCDFNSTDLSGTTYIYSHYYNKLEYVRFDSRVGEYVGYTQYGVKTAEAWNSGPELAQSRAERERLCLHNDDIFYQTVLTKSVQPYVRLRSTTPPSGKHPAMLVCSVFDFYPKQIRVSWTRDGQEVSSDVTSTEELADADWYYQIHSHLEYTPSSDSQCCPLLDWMNTWSSKPGPELSSDTQLVQPCLIWTLVYQLDSDGPESGLIWTDGPGSGLIWTLTILDQVSSGALAVSLADEAQPDGAVQVVETSAAVQVSTVLTFWTQTVICPTIRLPGLPAPSNHTHTHGQ